MITTFRLLMPQAIHGPTAEACLRLLCNGLYGGNIRTALAFVTIGTNLEVHLASHYTARLSLPKDPLRQVNG